MVYELCVTAKYFIGRVTLFFANNYLSEYRIAMEFLHNFFYLKKNCDPIFC